jgi:hypothetical protein
MILKNKILDEESIPDPENLIKSIAEQGYSLETSLADLIDNSISANASEIEILIDTNSEPFILFIADNGNGMTEDKLKSNMQFPSSSPENIRNTNDLGRFGLGLKTASFSQTRCFTVISRKKGESGYNARTWDVEYLKEKKKWNIIINTQNEIDNLLSIYRKLSKSFLNEFSNYNPNTIVIWQGLYKFENYLESSNKSLALKKELTEVTSEYLSLVFHRFLENKKKPLKIRINNNLIKPFNPFPDSEESGLRKLELNQTLFQTDKLKIEGYILPSRSLVESKGNSQWTMQNKSLMDMEGLYIYRLDRIILYGGWNGIIKKSPRLQLARLKVNIGNSVDHYFHLNVAKSSIVIPYELRIAFLRYISDLKTEAEKEYYNKGLKMVSTTEVSSKDLLFIRKASNRGMLLELNPTFPLLKNLFNELNDEQLKQLNVIIRIVNTTINRIRQVHENVRFNSIAEGSNINDGTLLIAINKLKESGLTSNQIKENIIPALGIEYDTLPEQILKLLK